MGMVSHAGKTWDVVSQSWQTWVSLSCSGGAWAHRDQNQVMEQLLSCPSKSFG